MVFRFLGTILVSPRSSQTSDSDAHSGDDNRPIGCRRASRTPASRQVSSSEVPGRQSRAATVILSRTRSPPSRDLDDRRDHRLSRLIRLVTSSCCGWLELRPLSALECR